MNVLIAAYYEFIKNLRDLKMLLVFMIFPIITILILGTVIQSEFSRDIEQKISVGYLNEDTEIIGLQFDQFIHSEEILKRVEVKEYTNLNEGEQALETGRIDNFIVLPDKLSRNLNQEEKSSIQLYGSKNVEFIESLIESFTRTYNAVDAVITQGGIPQTEVSENNLTRIVYGKRSEAPRAIDYYSVLTLLQMLVVGAIFGIYIVRKEDGSDLQIRMHTLPVNRWVLTLGRILGSVVYLTLTSGITIIATSVLYHSNWNGNPLVILATIIAFCSITVGIGILIGLFVKDFPTSLILVMILMIFYGTFSGSISPQSTNNAVSFLVPNYHAKILLFGTIHGYPVEMMAEATYWLLGMMAVIYGIAALVLRRNRYDHI